MPPTHLATLSSQLAALDLSGVSPGEPAATPVPEAPAPASLDDLLARVVASPE